VPRVDRDWAQLSERSREALALLGYTVEPMCLPHEAAPCGGTYFEHFAAHMAAMAALVNHHLMHCGPDAAPIYGVTYGAVSKSLSEDCDQHERG
jgi:hypothetical protein